MDCEFIRYACVCRKVCGDNESIRDIFSPTNTLDPPLNSAAGFCRDSASIPRVFISQLEEVQASEGVSKCDIEGEDSLLPKTNCKDSVRRM